MSQQPVTADLPVTPHQSEVLKYVIANGRSSVSEVRRGLAITDVREARQRLEALVGRGLMERHNDGEVVAYTARITAEDLPRLDVRRLRAVEATGPRGKTVDPRSGVKPEPRAASVLATQTAECPPHHMVIESPNGTRLVGGYCRKCGFTRDYYAAEPEIDGNKPMVYPASEKMVAGGASTGATAGRDKHQLNKREMSHTWGGSPVSVEAKRRSIIGLIKGKFAVASSH